MRVKTIGLLVLGLGLLLVSHTSRAEEFEYGPPGFERFNSMLKIEVSGKLAPGKKITVTVDDGGHASYIMYGDLLDKKLTRVFLKPSYRHPTSPTSCDIQIPERAEEILLKVYDYNSKYIPGISCNINLRTGQFQRLVEYKALSLGEIICHVEKSNVLKSRSRGRIMKVEAVRLPDDDRFMVRLEFADGNAISMVVTEYGLIKRIIEK